MEIIPIEYCEVAEKFVHLNQTLAGCAFDHKCGDSEFSCCPLREFFFKSAKAKKLEPKKDSLDMPEFYLLDQ